MLFRSTYTSLLFTGSIASNDYYNYYCLTINANNNDTYLNFMEFYITGKQVYSTTNNIIIANGGGDGDCYYFENIDRRYPSKQWTSKTTEVSTTFNGTLSSNVNITLDTSGITYGSGVYNIYYSSALYALDDIKNPYTFFDFDDTIGTVGGHFASMYNASTGAYAGTRYLVDVNYKGEWAVIKFPLNIIPTSYSILQRKIGRAHV